LLGVVHVGVGVEIGLLGVGGVRLDGLVRLRVVGTGDRLIVVPGFVILPGRLPASGALTLAQLVQKIVEEVSHFRRVYAPATIRVCAVPRRIGRIR
jgi:hypothetical protein